MQTKLIVGSAIAAILLLGAACGTKVATTNQAPIIANTAVANTNSHTIGSFDTKSEVSSLSIISITNAGVNPKSMTVSAGTTVQFKNQDTVTHEIASDSHPTDNELPGFDGRIAPGGMYSFTFSKVGTWGYHDNVTPLDAKFQGKVIAQ